MPSVLAGKVSFVSVIDVEVKALIDEAVRVRGIALEEDVIIDNALLITMGCVLVGILKVVLVDTEASNRTAHNSCELPSQL
jgi:hypothetical protein